MVSLRHFRDSDAAVLREFGNIDMPEEQLLRMIRDWNKLVFHGKYFEMFAVLHDDQLVGMISLYQLSASVISIGPEIFPAFRNRGFGKEAMAIALDFVRNKGYKIVSQQVRSDNHASIALHKSLGFETDDYGYINKKGKEILIFLKAL